MTRVAVGLPTYNGAAYLRDCLDCLTSQTHSEIDIVVCDNASDDETPFIAAEYAKNFPQIQHIRSSVTVPPIENFKRAFDATDAPYFLWRADDDLSSPVYIEALAKALDRSPEADLAVSALIRRTEFEETRIELPKINGTTLPSRVDGLLRGCRPTWIYGMWRRGRATDDIWRMASAYKYLWASDHMQMLPTLLRGAVTFSEDTDAVFQQNIVRVPTYILPPEEKLLARKLYSQIAFTELSQYRFESADERLLKRAMREHIDRCVAPFAQATRRAIKAKLKRLILHRTGLF